MAGPNDTKPKGRPMSMIALNFSAALDDLFKLGTVGELEETVQQKSRSVETQKSQLEDLDAQLREAEEKLKTLEIKHKRMSRHFPSMISTQAISNIDNNNSDTDDTEATSSSSDRPEQRWS